MARHWSDDVLIFNGLRRGLRLIYCSFIILIVLILDVLKSLSYKPLFFDLFGCLERVFNFCAFKLQSGSGVESAGRGKGSLCWQLIVLTCNDMEPS